MNIRSLGLFFLTMCLLADSACKKSSPVNGHVKTAIHTFTSASANWVDTTYYVYDAQGRLISTQINNNLPTLSTYYPDSVVQTSGGNTILVYYLNAHGLAVSASNGNTYSYDNNGYLISSNYYLLQMSSYVVSDGNIISAATIPAGTNDTIYDTYLYISKPNLMDRGTPYLGKVNMNLNSQTIGNQNGNLTTTTFAYTYDNQGRVLQRTITSDVIQVFNYTYY